jgi:hypothetical protein
MEDMDVVDLNALTNKVDVKLDMLRPFVMNQVGRHVDGRYVVTEDHHSLANATVELTEELSEPYAFHRCIGYCPVLRFGARPRHGWLPFGGPGDK